MSSNNNNKKRKTESIYKPNPRKEVHLIEQIGTLMVQDPRRLGEDIHRTILSIGRQDLFASINRCYVDPLVQLVRKSTCLLDNAKIILWFLYPTHHMGNDVTAACKELNRKIFTLDDVVVVK